jgi:acyl carrier protein
MSEDDIKAAIFAGLATIAPECDPAALSPDAHIRRTLDIDSYDFLNLLIGLHKKLGVDIPEADYGKLNTLNEMIAYLAARIR